MKYKIITICLFAGIVLNNLESQAQEFKNGDNVLGVGIGFGSSLGSYSYSSQTPGLSLQFEHGNWDVGGPGVISLGGYLGYKSYKYEGVGYNYNYTYKWSYVIIGLRSAYHFNMLDVKNLDVYGGLMLSYDFVSFSDTYSDPNVAHSSAGTYDGGLSLSLYVGGRYYLSQKVGVFMELGYGISYFNLGAAFKL